MFVLRVLRRVKKFGGFWSVMWFFCSAESSRGEPMPFSAASADVNGGAGMTFGVCQVDDLGMVRLRQKVGNIEKRRNVHSYILYFTKQS